MIKRYKTRILSYSGNPIEKYADNLIFWNDFQTLGDDILYSNITWSTGINSDTELSKLLLNTIDQLWMDRYSELWEGALLSINSEKRYIVGFEVGKILLNAPLSTAVTNVTVSSFRVDNLKNKATNSYALNSSAYRISNSLFVVDNRFYNRTGYTLRCNGPALPTFLYAIPSQLINITKFQFITDQCANWEYPPGGDSGNAGVPINKNTGTNSSINATGITAISWDSQNIGAYNKLISPTTLNNTFPKQKFATKIVEKDTLGYRFYWMNTKYTINGSSQGTIIDTNVHPFIQWSFYQFNGNPGGRFQELSYMFMLGNAVDLNERELNRFMKYLQSKYQL